MAEVPCEVRAGLRDSERTVTVKDVFNIRHHLRVEEGFITAEAGRYYLPIGIVGIDHAKGLVMIELPHESDGGTNRLWVRRSDLREIAETVA
jgi:hypothetical protein